MIVGLNPEGTFVLCPLMVLQPQVIEGKAQVWDLPKWLGIEASQSAPSPGITPYFPLHPLLHKCGKKEKKGAGFSPQWQGCV